MAIDVVWLGRGIAAGTAILSLAIIVLAIKCFQQIESSLKWSKFWYSISGFVMFLLSALSIFDRSNMLMYEIATLFVTANIFSSLLGTATRLSIQQFMFEQEHKTRSEDKDGRR